MGWYEYPPYVSVAERKKQVQKQIAQLRKKGRTVSPVVIEGKFITQTFWGKSWCQNLEKYSDFDNRLPRGRSYVRTGAVIDLQVSQGKITALVSGSSIYNVTITIKPIIANKWKKLVKACSGEIASLIELLQGKFSNAVMKIIIDPAKGLFPYENEIKMKCSCPDAALMCKHIAAVLYGIGARMDREPEALFILRNANHLDLISATNMTTLVEKTKSVTTDTLPADTDLSSIFDIEISTSIKSIKPKSVSKHSRSKKKVVKKTRKKVSTIGF